MQDLRLEEAAQKLQPLVTDPAAAPLWQIPANLGRIMESRRSFGAALEYYEIASAEVKDPRAASEVQYRISQCLRALGQGRESRRVLEYALDLNPENLKARAELSRLDSRQVY
jgi:tetratricopeptide (TPR) repeat protein